MVVGGVVTCVKVAVTLWLALTVTVVVDAFESATVPVQPANCHPEAGVAEILITVPWE